MLAGVPALASLASHIADTLVRASPCHGPSAAAVAVGDRLGEPIRVVRGFARTLDERGRPTAPTPLAREPVFDVGSITKIAATTALCMRLVDTGKLDLGSPVSRWLPSFTGDGKDGVSVRDLLEHQAGLWEWWPTYVDGASTAEAALRGALRLPLRYAPGTGRRYSDLGFMLLGEIVARQFGSRLDNVARSEVFEPLGMSDSDYRPRQCPRHAEPTDQVVATSVGDWYERRMVETGTPYPVIVPDRSFTGWRTHTLVGEANDGNCWHAFGGVAGHAGLFTTVTDLLRFGEALLASLDGQGTWSRDVVREFFRAGRDARQGLGFWIRHRSSGALVEHAGFPGARFAVLPQHRRVAVLLTNRLHTLGEPADIEPAWEQLIEKLEESG